MRLGNLAEDMSQRPPGQSISPMARKSPYKGNREMSDKSRNELRKRRGNAGRVVILI